MTKTQFDEKIDEMMPALSEAIRKECDRLWGCGGVDAESYDNNYILPKIIITVAIENQAHQYSPLSRNARKDYRNLRYF